MRELGDLSRMAKKRMTLASRPKASMEAWYVMATTSCSGSGDGTGYMLVSGCCCLSRSPGNNDQKNKP